MNSEDSHFVTPTGFESVYSAVSVTDYESDDENTEFIRPFHQLNTNELVAKLSKSSNLHIKMSILQLLLQREGPAYTVEEKSVKDVITDVYLKACYVHNWSVVRHGACLLGKTVPSLAPSITAMVVGGKQVRILSSFLTHSFPMHPFSFSDVFKGWRKGALGTNGLISV